MTLWAARVGGELAPEVREFLAALPEDGRPSSPRSTR